MPKPIRVDVDIVLVPVSVTDTYGRPILGLARDDFQILEEGREQQIRFFSSEDAPLSVGLILDISASMMDKIGPERDALREFAKHANPLDEYFAISVSNRPTLLANLTSDIDDIQAKLTLSTPAGGTALMDGIYLGLNNLRRARYERRVLLVISDGGENNSRYKSREIKRLAAEAGVLIYAIRPSDELPILRTIEEKMGSRTLAAITDTTGGRTIVLTKKNDIPEAAANISRELRAQYLIGYKPPESPSRDDEWRKIKVRILNNKGGVMLQPHYKKGYFSSR